MSKIKEWKWLEIDKLFGDELSSGKDKTKKQKSVVHTKKKDGDLILYEDGRLRRK